MVSFASHFEDLLSVEDAEADACGDDPDGSSDSDDSDSDSDDDDASNLDIPEGSDAHDSVVKIFLSSRDVSRVKVVVVAPTSVEVETVVVVEPKSEVTVNSSDAVDGTETRASPAPVEEAKDTPAPATSLAPGTVVSHVLPQGVETQLAEVISTSLASPPAADNASRPLQTIDVATAEPQTEVANVNGAGADAAEESQASPSAATGNVQGAVVNATVTESVSSSSGGSGTGNGAAAAVTDGSTGKLVSYHLNGKLVAHVLSHTASGYQPGTQSTPVSNGAVDGSSGKLLAHVHSHEKPVAHGLNHTAPGNQPGTQSTPAPSIGSSDGSSGKLLVYSTASEKPVVRGLNYTAPGTQPGTQPVFPSSGPSSIVSVKSFPLRSAARRRRAVIDGVKKLRLRPQRPEAFHHRGRFGTYALRESNTPMEISLMVGVLGTKVDRSRADNCRLYAIMRRACEHVDPLLVVMPEGAPRPIFRDVWGMVRYARDRLRIRKLFSMEGSWLDTADGTIALDDGISRVDQVPRVVVSSSRLPCAMACVPSPTLERKLKAKRMAVRPRRRVLNWTPKPSPLREMTVVEEPPSEGETTAPLTPVSPIVLTRLVPEDAVMVPSPGDEDGGMMPQGKALAPLKSDFEEHWIDMIRKASAQMGPVSPESHTAAPIKPWKSGLTGQDWVDFTPSGPDQESKADVLGHNLRCGLRSFVDIVAFPLLLEPEPVLAPERPYALECEDDNESLYSRDIDQTRRSHETQISNGSAFDRLSSVDFYRDVSQYNAIVAGELEAASFDDDPSATSSAALPLVADPLSAQSPSSPSEPAAVPLPPSPNSRPRKTLKKQARNPGANSRGHMILRHRVSPLHARRPLRRSLSTMANKDRRCPCRKQPSPDPSPVVSAEPQSQPQSDSDVPLSESQLRFPDDYDSFDRLGVEPPRRRLNPLVLLGKCISKVRKGTRTLLEKTKKGLAPRREGPAEGESGRRVGRKLQKRRR